MIGGPDKLEEGPLHIEHSIPYIQRQLRDNIGKFSNAFDSVVNTYPALRTEPDFEQFITAIDQKIRTVFSKAVNSIRFDRILKSDDPESEARTEGRDGVFHRALGDTRRFVSGQRKFPAVSIREKYESVVYDRIQELCDGLSVALEAWAGNVKKK